jgi:hypothetical protein
MRVVAPSGNPDDTGGCEIIVAVVPCQFKPNSTNLRSAHLTRDPAAAAFWPSCSTTKSASCQSRVPGEPAFWPDRRIIFSRLAVCLCRLGRTSRNSRSQPAGQFAVNANGGRKNRRDDTGLPRLAVD